MVCEKLEYRGYDPAVLCPKWKTGPLRQARGESKTLKRNWLPETRAGQQVWVIQDGQLMGGTRREKCAPPPLVKADVLF